MLPATSPPHLGRALSLLTLFASLATAATGCDTTDKGDTTDDGGDDGTGGDDSSGEGSGGDGTGDDGTTDTPDPLGFPAEVLGIPNLDDDNENGDHDWNDELGSDDDYVALPITGGIASSETVSVSLTGDVDSLRVWLDGAVVLDDTSTSFELTSADDLSTLAVEFAMPMASGTLEISSSSGDSWTVDLQAAPLILNHHLQPYEWVNAVDFGGGAYGNAAFINTFTDNLGSSFSTVNAGTVDYDAWIQDEIEFGTFTIPGKRMDFVIDSIRIGNGTGLDDYPDDHLFGPDFGSFTWGSGRSTSQDSFGNMEVSPPITVDGVEYPFGRIYYGASGRLAPTTVLTDMLEDQKVQDPFSLDIEFLCVGHVDEFITMLPDPDAPKGFRVWVADVDVGRDFLETLDPDATLSKYTSAHGYSTPGEMLEHSSLWTYNRDVQDEYIEPNIDILKSELGLDESDFVRVPALFERSSECAGYGLALIPATVNMQVSTHEDGVGADLFIPDPFLRSSSEGTSDDPFIAEFEAMLPANLNPIWTNDWNTYHLYWGEVHCGSNTVRTPTADWWTDASHLLED